MEEGFEREVPQEQTSTLGTDFSSTITDSRDNFDPTSLDPKPTSSIS